jgi:starvation-inducible DNA-binding protein
MEIKLINSVQRLLANVFNEYLHAHGFHWNVVGSQFAQLHDFFEEIYEDVHSSIDPIAEILRKLDVKSPFQLSEFIKLKNTQEYNPSDAMGMITSLSMINTAVISNLSEVFDIANKLNHQDVCNFVSGRLEMHQKWAWQLRSFKG